MTAIESGQHVKNSAQAWWSDQLPPPEYRIDSLDQSGLLDAVSEGSRQPINSRRKGHHGLFPAGDYTYSFEFLVHDSLPETINTDLISTRYYLEVMIESPGPFHSKMRSQLDIPLIRLPSENSLELIEPIISSKDWRDQLHYDVCIFGRSFRLGSRIPMRVKLTPLVNLECRWIRVYVSQHVQHWTMGREPRRLQLPTKKVLLFEKQAGLASYSTYPGSRMRITTDKGMIRPPVMQKGNLLGQILETSEIELEVQLPRCPEMKVREKRQWLQLSTKGGRPDVNHWIQVRNRENSHSVMQ